jgi:hypothetical protein
VITPMISRSFLVFACCLLASGCQVAQMRVDPALSLVMPLQVTGFRFGSSSKHIDFGKWSVEQTRGGSATSDRKFLVLETDYAFVPYEFTLSEAGRPVTQGICLAQGLVYSLGSVTVEPPTIVPPLTCTLSGQGLVSLSLKNQIELVRDREAATVSFDDGSWRIDSIHEIEQVRGPSEEPVGYRIVAGDKPGGKLIAEVETINRGRVWIAPDLSPQDAVRAATVATVLLLYHRQQPADRW